MPVRKNDKGNRKVCHYWDYSFEWTNEHISSSELECWIWNDGVLKRDSYALLQENYESHPKLAELWKQVNTIPNWVNWAQIQRGQEIYWRYLTPISNAQIVYQGLLGGMGTIRVGETLTKTGGFCAKIVRRRLLETLQYTIQVNSDAEAMKPGGEGHLACVRVRLLHSAVRLKIMSLAEQDPTYYNVQKYGPPINDLDSLSTIHAFSGTAIWQGLPRQGIYLSNQEAEDYIALWRLVAYYMGVPNEPFQTAARAKAMNESLLVNEFAPNDTGRMLARNIVVGLENTAPTYASKEYMDAMTRLVNGDQLSDELHVPKTSLYYRLLMWGYCYWVQTQIKIVLRIPIIDQYIIAYYRRFAWRILMDKTTGLGKKALFDFNPVSRCWHI
ncbi:hypothetical protein QQS21_000697 [Conoideocrella luteorostrata]|uniref:ER-bound oxygenase mpaB/mpaB'/Rubber oxygenase catalytic domain-containing protein n=1 Tax=Conoideocrella luteorostrata TaxID=1105319 RepID=A0AAJ0D128_9HYPO|nr:hypothetical protein QQS21_000697 [Conoideocrella luteorostrata]